MSKLWIGVSCVVCVLFTTLLHGCGDDPCGPGMIDRDGDCVRECAAGTFAEGGQYVTSDEDCAEGSRLVDGVCVADADPCPQGQVEVGGVCVDWDRGECLSLNGCGASVVELASDGAAIDFTMVEPVCPNGMLEWGEECDDGDDGTLGDGCTGCQIDPAFACDTSSDPSACVPVSDIGTFAPGDDVPDIVRRTTLPTGQSDFYRITFTSALRLTGSLGATTRGDPDLLLYSSDWRILGEATTDGGELFGWVLDAGTYLIQILAVSELVDGYMLALEIEQPCTGVVPGSFIVEDPREAISLRGITTIEGDFVIEAVDVARLVDASCLTSVEGDLTITATPALSRIDLPSLSHVGGNLDVSENTALTRIDFPALTHIGGDLDIDHNPLVSRLELMSLSFVGGHLRIRENPLLSQCVAWALQRQLEARGFSGAVDIAGNAVESCYHYVLVMDLESAETAGVDLDAIELVQGDERFFADEWHECLLGPGIEAAGVTDTLDCNQALGPPNNLEGECTGSDRFFVNLGGLGGSIVVSFDHLRPINSGDTIRVYECGRDNDTYSARVGVGSSVTDPYWHVCMTGSGVDECTVPALPTNPFD